MTWTAPRTWTSSETLTAALLNEQIRENLLHQAPQSATGQRGYFASTGLNDLTRRSTHRAGAIGSVTTTSTTYVNPSSSPGPATTLTTDTQAVVIIAAWAEQRTVNDNSVFMSIAVSGATTIAASDEHAMRKQSDIDMRFSAAQFRYFNTLTPGTNTFTCNYRVGGGQGTWWRRRIMVLPL